MMRTPVPTVPTDRLEAVLHGAKGAAETALERGQELLETDTAQEILRRAGAVVTAAKGLDHLQVTTHKSRRWPFGALMLGTGAVIGAAVAIVSRRMSTPVPDPMLDDARDYPVKGGTVDLTRIDDPVAELATSSSTSTSTSTSTANGVPTAKGQQTERKNG
jgi:hypothetical protein